MATSKTAPAPAGAPASRPAAGTGSPPAPAASAPKPPPAPAPKDPQAPVPAPNAAPGKADRSDPPWNKGRTDGDAPKDPPADSAASAGTAAEPPAADDAPRSTDRLSKLDQQIADLQRQRAVLVARQREESRKRDTRRKILLGAAVVGLLRKGDADTKGVVAKALRTMKARERELFEMDDFPSAGSPSG